MKVRIAILVLVVGLALFLAGCGPTKIDVILELKPQYDALRADLQTIAATLPEKAEDQAVAQPLEPAPYFNSDDYSVTRNTDVMMYEHLLDPEEDLADTGKLDLLLSNLKTYVYWTGPKSPYLLKESKSRADDEFRAKFEQAPQIRYLGIARINHFDPIVAVNAETFKGGYTDIDGFLVDMQTQEIVCSFNMTVRPDEDIHYAYKEGESQTYALAEAARSNLWSNARDAFLDNMAEMCGGSFEK